MPGDDRDIMIMIMMIISMMILMKLVMPEDGYFPIIMTMMSLIVHESIPKIMV